MATKDWKKSRKGLKNVSYNTKTQEYIQVEKTLNLQKDKDMWRLISQDGGSGGIRNISWHNSYKSALRSKRAYMRKN